MVNLEKRINLTKGADKSPTSTVSYEGTLLNQTEVTLSNIKYEVGIDADGNTYAKTFNGQYNIWVRLLFAPDEDATVLQSVLDTLKRDYLERAGEIYGCK